MKGSRQRGPARPFAPDPVAPGDPGWSPAPPSRSLLREARRYWWLPLLLALVAMLVAWLVTARTPREYEATAAAAIAPAPEVVDQADLARSLEALDRRTIIATFARIAEARRTRDAAAARLGRPAPELARYRVSAQVVPSTNVLRVRVAGPDARMTAAVANAVSAATAAEARQLYRIFVIEPLDPAVPAPKPARPDAGRNLAVALVLGLGTGLALALAAALARRTLALQR